MFSNGVVVDTCRLLFSDISSVMTSGHSIVLPHAVVSDINGRPDARQLIAKLHRLVRSKPEAIVVAHTWGEVALMESQSGSAIQPRQIVDVRSTDSVRAFADSSESEWVQAFDDVRSDITLGRYKDSHQSFNNHCDDFARWVKDRVSVDSTMLATLRSVQSDCWRAIRAAVVDSRLVSVWVNECANAELLSRPIGTVSQDKNPDLAITRVAKILLAYSLLQVSGAMKDWNNNFDDAQFAFTASYTGHLMTKDKHLRKMVGAIFPDVQLFDVDL